MALILFATEVRGEADSDMDHGIDFDFSNDKDDDMIPVTPMEQDDDAPVEEVDPDLIVPHNDGDDSQQEDKGWYAYLDYLDFGKDYFMRALKYVSVKINRFFLTAKHKPSGSNKQAFKYGLYDGLFKLQPRAHSNCLTEGPTYLVALTHFSVRMLKNHLDVGAQEEFALEDLMQGFISKCTLQDTLPATMILNFLMFAIDELPEEYSRQMRSYRIMFRLIDIWGLMIAASDLAGGVNLLLYKTDGFILGKILGIMIKIYVQYKLSIITGNAHYLDRGTAAADIITF